MQILLALGVSLLTAAAPQPQPSPLTSAKTLNLTFINTVTLEEAISTFATVGQITIEVDQTVSDAVLRTPLSESGTNMRDVTLEQALEFVTSLKGLSYRVIDGRTVVIFKKP